MCSVELRESQNTGKMSTLITAASEYAKDQKIDPEDIKSLQEWLKKQPHLPQHITEEFLILIFHSSDYSVEKSKHLLEKNLTCRTNFTEMFTNVDPLSPQNQQVWKYFDIWLGPKLTEDKNRIIYFGFHNFDAELFDYPATVRVLESVLETTQAEKGVCNGYTAIINIEGITLSHVAKANISYIRNHLYYIQEAINIKIKAIHLINISPILDKIMFIIKPFLKKELVSIMYFHSGQMEDFYKAISRDLLPNEIGGTMGTKKELIDETRNRLERLRSWMIDQEKLQIDKSKQLNRKEDDLSMAGSFRKLNLD